MATGKAAEEKLSMKDSFKREINYLRVSVTELCNLRCGYCMPEGGVFKKRHDEMLSEEELICAVRAAASLGINKVRITGGEPLLKKNILSICERIAGISGIKELCLTSNAVLLPKLAKPLLSAGVSRVNISLDTLMPEKYERITRIGCLEDALAGLYAALGTGFERVKINTVLLGGINDDEIPSLADLTMQNDIDLRFIELMPIGEAALFPPSAFISCDSAAALIPALEPLPDKEGVAKLYRLPDAKGRVGFISPVSAHFCGDCNRLRLTADGRLKPCLHSAEEISLKGMDYNGMRGAIEAAIMDKPLRHGALSPFSRSETNRSMNQIGG